MSVIVAKSASCCASPPPPVTYSCYPAVSIQRTVPVGSTISIDGVSVSSFRSVKYCVVITTTDARARVYEVSSTHRGGANPTFNCYGIIGDFIDQVPSVSVVAGVLNFKITNNDTSDFLVFVTRMAIPLTNSVTNAVEVVEIGDINSLVRASATNTIDLVSTTNTIATQWIIAVTDSSGNRSITHVLALTTATPLILEYGKTGSTLNYSLAVNVISGLGIELALVNQDLVDYRVDVTRIPVQTASTIPFCGFSSGLSLWLPTPTTIAPHITSVVDSQISISSHTSMKWLVGIHDATAIKTMCFELEVVFYGSTTSLVYYGIVGDNLAPTISTAIVSGDLHLSITNNRSNSVVVNLLRIPTAL